MSDSDDVSVQDDEPQVPVRDDGPKVAVHARLPALDGDGELPWKWQRVLEVPISTISAISPDAPWRWLLFACGAVFGTTRCTLCTSEDRGEVLSLDEPAPTSPTEVYFHVDETDRDSMLPVEPDMYRSRTASSTTSSDSSCAGERSTDFRERVEARDGNACVVTQFGIRKHLRAFHIIPHSKGDEYIRTLTSKRRDAGNDSNTEVIDNIDDVRNGIYAWTSVKICLGQHAAIMKKPNFVFPDAPESWEIHALLHALIPMVFGRAVEPVTVPAGNPKDPWPPAVLFDFVYGAAVLDCFGLPDATQAISRISSKVFGDINSRQRERREEERIARNRRRQEADREPDGRNGERPPEFATWQSLLSLDDQWGVYNFLKDQAEAKRDAEAKERVAAWLDKAQT